MSRRAGDPVTPADAQALHDNAAARGKWLIWTLTDGDIEHRGWHVASAPEAIRPHPRPIAALTPQRRRQPLQRLRHTVQEFCPPL